MKKEIKASLGSLADKVGVAKNVVFEGKIQHILDENNDVVNKAAQQIMETGRLITKNDKKGAISVLSETEFAKELEVMDAGERLIEFAKQRNTNVDAIFSYLMDFWGKESTLGKKGQKKGVSASNKPISEDLPITQTKSGWAEEQRKRKCGF